MFDLKNMTTVSHSTGTLINWNILYVAAIIVIYSCYILNPIVVLTTNGLHLDCATIVFSERYSQIILISIALMRS